MKANRVFGILKAIAFLTVVFFFFSCNPDEPVPPVKAIITLQAAEDVTLNSATLVASVIPNEDSTSILFMYAETNSNWIIKTVSKKFSGKSAIKVTLGIDSLKVNTLYHVKAKATNVAGIETAYGEITFTTLQVPPPPVLTKAVVAISSSEIKLSTAKLIASVIPNQPNTTVSIEYHALDSDWQTKVMGTDYSGTSAIEIPLDLSNLAVGTKFFYRVKATNIAGEVTSQIKNFDTYAVADYDGNLYHSVIMKTKYWVNNTWVSGSSIWLRENFKGTHYANGDPIPNVTDAIAWGNLTTGAYCYYNNDSKNGEIYGGLYNWYVGADPRGLIVGWHTPTGH